MLKPLAAPGHRRLTELAATLRAIAVNPDHVPDYREIIKQVNSGRIPAPLVAANRREFCLDDVPMIAETLGIVVRKNAA
jgi:hypothetical protein